MLPNESLDSGSNYNFQNKAPNPSLGFSAFDLSHLCTTTIPREGLVVPIAVIPCIPHDEMEISVDSLIRVMPQVVPLYSRQRLYTYAFYSRACDLWNNFETFMWKGYNGRVLKSIPKLKNSNLYKTNDNAPYNEVQPDSLGDFLGLPIGAKTTDLAGKISAMIPMMGLRVYRDYFMNKNYHIEDKVLLPDDDTTFRLNDDGELISAKNVGVDVKFDIVSGKSVFDPNTSGFVYGVNYYAVGTGGTRVFSPDYSYSSEDDPLKYPHLHAGLFWHEYPDDYFTSALPWPQRGQEASIDFGTIKANFASEYYGGDIIATDLKVRNGFNGRVSLHGVSDANIGQFNSAIEKSLTLSSGGFTLNQLRALAVDQTELEKCARVNGYKEFGQAFFGISCKNSTEFKPIFIGGNYQNITFTEVLQTSASTSATETDPASALGQYAGHGISSASDSYLGKVTCDDFGYIIVYACIMPDIYYSQGLDKFWTDSMQSDFYLPERAKLGLRPILGRELYFSGNTAEDEKLWAYQNPFDELRYMPNRIHGKIAEYGNETFFPYTQSRYFGSKPEYGQAFALADHVRKDYLVAGDEDHYTAQFRLNIKAKRMLPYKPIPASILN